jgi:hypothetical protein
LGYVVDKVALGQVISVLRFPLPIFIPPIASQSPSYIIWGWYNRPVLAAVPSGFSLTPLTIKNLKNLRLQHMLLEDDVKSGGVLETTDCSIAMLAKS